MGNCQNTDEQQDSEPRHSRHSENSDEPTDRTESAQYVLIPLTRGKVAKVSPEDARLVRLFKWCATQTHRGHWYAKRKIKRNGKYTSEMLHRFIMQAPPGMDVDHINGDGLDCTRGNMRLATRSQNAGNRRRLQKNKSSRFKGVSWDTAKGKWRANIAFQGQKMHLGYFTDEMEAARAYERAHKLYFKDFSPSRAQIRAVK